MRKKRHGFFHEHSLSLVAAGILLLWVVLYLAADPETRLGAFFGNSVADWAGVVLVVVGTKFLYERGSKESKAVPGRGKGLRRFLIAHSLTIFVVVTGLVWLALFSGMDASSRWGQVVGNLLSEWLQVLGIVLLTKKLFERGSEESKKA